MVDGPDFDAAEYILKPQTGQKWRIGLVSRVKIFFVPLIEMSEMKMSASSNECILLRSKCTLPKRSLRSEP